jgi:hypothetical protein
MSIQVSCDCEMTYRLPDRYAGKRCRCRECGDSIRVPRSIATTSSHESHSEVEEARRASTRVKKKQPARARAGRGEGPASESLHQIAPLPLSEPRGTEPARAVRVAKGALAVAKKTVRKDAGDRDRRRGRDEDEPTRSARLRGAARRNRMGRRDEDEDEDEREERRRPKTGKRDSSKDKKSRERDEGRKSKGKTGKVSRRPRDEEEDESEEGEEDEKPRRPGGAALTPMQIFLGSIGLALLSLIGLVGVFVHKDNVAKATDERGKQVMDGLEKAHAAMTNQDLDAAKRGYEAAIELCDQKDIEVVDPKILDARGKGKEELAWIALAIDAKSQNGSADAMGKYLKLLEGPDPAIREVGVRLCGQTIGTAAEPPLKEIASKLGDQPKVSKAAFDALNKALDTQKGQELVKVLVVVLDTTEPKLLVKALNKLAEIPDAQLFEKKINEHSRSPNAEVAAAAKAVGQGPKESPKDKGGDKGAKDKGEEKSDKGGE